jgi:hypothetical protein
MASQHLAASLATRGASEAASNRHFVIAQGATTSLRDTRNTVLRSMDNDRPGQPSHQAEIKLPPAIRMPSQLGQSQAQ